MKRSMPPKLKKKLELNKQYSSKQSVVILLFKKMNNELQDKKS